jgi:hypothetical protein
MDRAPTIQVEALVAAPKKAPWAVRICLSKCAGRPLKSFSVSPHQPTVYADVGTSRTGHLLEPGWPARHL